MIFLTISYLIALILIQINKNPFKDNVQNLKILAVSDFYSQ